MPWLSHGTRNKGIATWTKPRLRGLTPGNGPESAPASSSRSFPDCSIVLRDFQKINYPISIAVPTGASRLLDPKGGLFTWSSLTSQLGSIGQHRCQQVATAPNNLAAIASPRGSGACQHRCQQVERRSSRASDYHRARVIELLTKKSNLKIIMPYYLLKIRSLLDG